MTVLAYELPPGGLYAPEMATTEIVGVEDARKGLSGRLRAAAKEEIHTVVTVHGQPSGVIVDMAWYTKAREALGDPTDIRVRPPEPPRTKKPKTAPKADAE